MVRKALLIGINYRGMDEELNGCINDCHNLANMLKTRYGYKDSEITMLTDDTKSKPTHNNIMSEMYKMIHSTNRENVEELWISYSGHGSYMKDRNSDEADGQDESLVPLDYKTKGLIRDDTLHHMLTLINEKTKAVILIDACHSGSMLDLKYRYMSGLKEVIENPKDFLKSNIVMLSGCMDSQTSADFYNRVGREYAGAMSVAFLKVMEEYDYDITCYKLLKKMREHLAASGFTQIPQLCCTRKLSTTSVFSLNQKNEAYLEVKK